MQWIPLHTHSQYSILEAMGSPKDIVEKARSLDMPAVALTDGGNLYGAVEFFQACLKAKIKPILGLEAYIAPGSRLEKKRIPGVPHSQSLVLLACDQRGYKNLCQLATKGSLEGFYYRPRIDRELLELHSEGLICLSGNLGGHLAGAVLYESMEEVKKRTQWYLDLFGDRFYLELQRHTMAEDALDAHGMHKEAWLLQKYESTMDKQRQVNAQFVNLSREWNIPLVATNNSHYLMPEDWKAHEILMNVQSGEACEILQRDSTGQSQFRVPNPKRQTLASHQLYFTSPQEMQERFSDIPEALENTLKIAELCHLSLDFETKHYPVYIPPSCREKDVTKEERIRAVADHLWELCSEGIEKRYTKERLEKVGEQYPEQDPKTVVAQRLKHEMEVITSKGMADYLLIVWDFIHWAKTHSIPVGPGRGSGAGSIVLYLIGITDIEPLRFNLFFERFINPERLSYPDIDVDICMEKRGEVIDYTVQTYGKANVAQIITFGTMKAKMAIKDVGRVLSVPLSKVAAICKLVPEELNITIEKALEVDPDLSDVYASDNEAKRVIDFARQLEGSVRNTGIHAAGVIIAGEPLEKYIPLCRSKDSDLPATQYSMKPVEAVGMLKVDFLGLKTLTSIQTCVDGLAEKGIAVDWMNLALDDANAFTLLNQGKTLGVFQMESGGMQDLAQKLHLDRFEEVIAVLSLYRPGPMDMIPSFIARKHGREPIEYDHPWMEKILEETYGIMVYQEQVMQIASKLANYSLGEGDVLRRAMGKKDGAQMAKEREKFRAGAKKNKIDEDLSMRIFDKMEKFASYGFNKSHAAAYGYLTYVTAYLKANYPSDWMAALMTCDRDDITKVSKFITECQTMGIDVLPPDVNESGQAFVATPQGVRFALTAIKGVGQGAVEAIILERSKGHFESLYNFCARVDTKKVGKKAIESLIDAGCFDFTSWSRDALLIGLDTMFDVAVREQREKASGMMSLFDTLDEDKEGRFRQPPEVQSSREANTLFFREKELLGFFVTGHPMDGYRPIMQRLSCTPLGAVEGLNDGHVFRSAFLVESVQTRISSKNQRKFAILKISDGVVQFELPVWPEIYEEKSEILQENALLYAVLQADRRDGHLRLNAAWLDDLTVADEVMIRACDEAYDRQKMRKAMHSRPGVKKTVPSRKEVVKKEVVLHLHADLAALRLSQVLRLKEILRSYPGQSAVQVHFKDGVKTRATLHVDKRWTVKQESVISALQEIPSLMVKS